MPHRRHCVISSGYPILAGRGVKVYLALRDGTLEEARRAVSMIVGRDTDRLDRDRHRQSGGGDRGRERL
ncbi:MAG: hypothetical protein ACLSAF_16395 [Intestinimonas sp.]